MQSINTLSFSMFLTTMNEIGKFREKKKTGCCNYSIKTDNFDFENFGFLKVMLN